ncbi:Vesicle-associated membrane protein [Erysiphe necator]|nr:Vesicle-associated membrane protein [Erysiphe necator]
MASSSNSTSLFYTCILYNSTILAEHSTSASFQSSSLLSVILPKISHNVPQKLTYTLNSKFIHYIADAPSEFPLNASAGRLTYLVVAEPSLGRRIPFGFLFDVKKKFLEDYPVLVTDFASLPHYGAGSFNSELKKMMIKHATIDEGKQDAIQNLQGEVDNVRGIMSQNIDSLLERGERIDLLIDKTDRLGGTAHDFRIRSRGLRRRMWWKNIKLILLLIFVVLTLAYLTTAFACGFPGWSKCISY